MRFSFGLFLEVILRHGFRVGSGLRVRVGTVGWVGMGTGSSPAVAGESDVRGARSTSRLGFLVVGGRGGGLVACMYFWIVFIDIRLYLSQSQLQMGTCCSFLCDWRCQVTPPPCGCVRVGEVQVGELDHLEVSEDVSTEEMEGEACL